MKKLIMLVGLLFLLSGCTVVRIDTADIDNTINIILSKENKLYNQIGKGYKYYIPRGVTYIDTDELNDKLYSNGDYYYLYIDAVSYYYQVPINYEENENLYYSQKIKINDKEGYLQIEKYEGKYLINFVYNYARIETLVDENKIHDAVLNCSYILSTIKFNHNIVKLMLDSDYLTNTEEKYDLFIPRKVVSDHIEYPDENRDKIDEEEQKEENENVNQESENQEDVIDDENENKKEEVE